VDYGHNPAAIEAIGEMTAAWNVSRITAILGVPGDRSDEMIRLSGEAAARVFDRIIIREDEDLRERGHGEVANLIHEGILRCNPGVDCSAVLDPTEALLKAIASMQENELVIYFYEDLSTTLGVLERYGARKVSDFADLLQGSHQGHEEVSAWH
jgi:cyanophycin synthetase